MSVPFKRNFEYITGDFRSLWNALIKETDPNLARGNFVFAHLVGILWEQALLADSTHGMFGKENLAKALFDQNPKYSYELMQHLANHAVIYGDEKLDGNLVAVTGAMPGRDIDSHPSDHMQIKDGVLKVYPEQLFADLKRAIEKTGMLEEEPKVE